MSTPIKFLHSDFNASSAKNSGAMKKIMGNEDVAHVLRDRSDQKTFYDTLKKYQGDSHALQKTLGELRADKHDGISGDKARAIAKELIRSGRRFITPEKDIRPHSPYVGAPEPFNSERHSPAAGRSGTGPQLSAQYAKNNSAIMRSGLIKNN